MSMASSSDRMRVRKMKTLLADNTIITDHQFFIDAVAYTAAYETQSTKPTYNKLVPDGQTPGYGGILMPTDMSCPTFVYCSGSTAERPNRRYNKVISGGGPLRSTPQPFSNGLLTKWQKCDRTICDD